MNRRGDASSREVFGFLKNTRLRNLFLFQPSNSCYILCSQLIDGPSDGIAFTGCQYLLQSIVNRRLCQYETPLHVSKVNFGASKFAH